MSPASNVSNCPLSHFAIRETPHSARRREPESRHALRSPFQRDRDRIIHSRAFRRLEYKTQVFLSGEGDHYRTRMTHTIEVVAIARTLARGLGVNEDVTEAIAMAHDLGHTPFGHVGERVLDRLLADHGGFDHNQQSLRVVDSLEKKYPDREGLNLTWAVRTGLVKRRGQTKELDGVLLPPQPSLEAQTADLADDVAYYAHDVDDGIVAGLLTMDQLNSVRFWRMALDDALTTGGDRDADYFSAYVVRCLIDRLVGNIIDTSEARIRTSELHGPDDVTERLHPLVDFSEDFRSGSREFRTFLFENLYWNELVLGVNRRAETAVEGLFRHFVAHPQTMGRGAQARVERDGTERAAADYLAGMTDVYAIEKYRELLNRTF